MSEPDTIEDFSIADRIRFARMLYFAKRKPIEEIAKTLAIGEETVKLYLEKEEDYRFKIVWSWNGAEGYPRLIRTSKDDPEGMTLSVCKEEIIEQCERYIDHWNAMVRNYRAVSLPDAIKQT